MAVAKSEHVELPITEVFRAVGVSLLTVPFALALLLTFVGKSVRAVLAYYIVQTLPNTPMVAWGLILCLAAIATVCFGYMVRWTWRTKKSTTAAYAAFRNGAITADEMFRIRRENLSIRKPSSIAWIGFIAGHLMLAPIFALMLWSAVQVPYLAHDRTKAIDASPQATLKRNMPQWEESGIIRPLFKNH